MAITFGNVPKPFERRIIDKDAGWRWGERTIRGVCLHSMVGYLWGTETYFSTFNHAIPGGGHGWNALTDFGVGGSMDPNLDGAVWMWNEPAGNRVPFANGWGDEGPGLEGDGPGYVDRYGVGAVNSDLISIERSDGGDINSPVSAKQFEAVCQTAAWVIDQARIPWTTWPKNNDGAQAIYWHSEFALKACPFGPMEGRTTAIIDRVRDILKHFQEGGAAPPKEPKYAKPDKPPAYDGTDKTVNGIVFHADKRTVKVAVEGLNCRKWAGTDAPLTRSPMKQGKGFGVRYWITGENVDGEDRWWVTAAGSRVWVGGTVQQPSRDRGLPAGARGEAAASSAWG